MPRRSKKVVFLPFCVLCQSVKAEGLVRTHPAVVEPLPELFREHDINMVQLPCPEMLGEGLVRGPHDITYYERQDFVDLCCSLACEHSGIIEKFSKAGFSLVGILGIERSPSCSVGNVKSNGKLLEGNGIFMRQLLGRLHDMGIEPFTLSLDLGKLEEALEILRERIVEMRDDDTIA